MRPPPAAEWRFPSFLIREFFGRVKVAMVVGSSCVAHLSSASCAKGKSSLGLALRRISFPLPWVAIGWASTGFDEASMGFKQWYDRHVMPRLVTLACSQGQIMKRRSLVVPLARGKVFELGCGGGLNQQFYDEAAVTGFSGIDPHAGLLDGARLRKREKGWECELREGVGEDIPLDRKRTRLNSRH